MEKLFTQKAEERGCAKCSECSRLSAKRRLLQVFGHPLFGGQRITLYNGESIATLAGDGCRIASFSIAGVPDAAVDAVAQFMRDFEKQHR